MPEVRDRRAQVRRVLRRLLLVRSPHERSKMRDRLFSKTRAPNLAPLIRATLAIYGVAAPLSVHSGGSAN